MSSPTPTTTDYLARIPDVLLEQVAFEPNTGCWLWAGSRNEDLGYGRVPVCGKRWGAHRLFWTLANNRWIPDGLSVCHRCDVPLCVNPAHLFLGTHVENMHDMAKKRRHVVHTRPGWAESGERRYNAKLTNRAVTLIRQLAASGMSQARIARYCGMDRSTICGIVHGERWKHVPMPEQNQKGD